MVSEPSEKVCVGYGFYAADVLRVIGCMLCTGVVCLCVWSYALMGVKKNWRWLRPYFVYCALGWKLP